MTNEERKKRKQERDRKKRQERYLLKDAGSYPTIRDYPPPEWPKPGIPIKEYSKAELYAVGIHPMLTGLGTHPRVMSDEDWVESLIQWSSILTLTLVLGDMVYLLRKTQSLWNNPKGRGGPLGDYPAPVTKRVIPLTVVDEESECWTGTQVRELLLNPVLCGLGQFQAVIPVQLWVSGVAKAVHDPAHPGIPQVLVDILFLLKRAFGFPGNDEIRVPFGYLKGDDK